MKEKAMVNLLLKQPCTVNSVLVVGEEEKFVRFVSIVLKQIGYAPFTCQSVAEARKQIEAHQVGLVLTDIVMSRESGFDLMRWVTRQHPQLPVIAMLAHATVAIENQLPKLGFTAIIYKPFTVDLLCQAVQQVMPLRPKPEWAQQVR